MLLLFCNKFLFHTLGVAGVLAVYRQAFDANYHEVSESLPWIRKASAMTESNSLPKLRPNYRKILEAILYLINEAERRGVYVTEYDIVKSVFLSDVAHLNRFGRPITFDNFLAMEHGPVPSATRDVLREDFKSQIHFNEQWPPWDREKSPADGPNAFRFVHPKRKDDSRVLSETDRAELSEALAIVKSLKFAGVKDQTHKHKAYTEAWARRGTLKASEIDYALLLEEADPDLVEDLVYSSKRV